MHEVSRSTTVRVNEALHVMASSQLESLILRLMAVYDDVLPWSVLSRLLEAYDEGIVTVVLGNLVRADFIQESGLDVDIGYSFCSPVIREVVCQQLSRVEVHRVHKAFANVWRDNPLRYAHHVRSAGSLFDTEQVVAALCDAGHHCLLTRQFSTASEYFAHALHAIESSLVRFSKEQVLGVQIALAETLCHRNAWAEASALLERAYLTGVSGPLRVRICRLIGWTLATSSPDQSARYTEEGLRHWDRLVASDDVFWMLRERVDSCTNLGDTEGATQYLAELRDYVRRFPTERTEILLATHEAVIKVIDWQGQAGVPLDGDLWLERALALGDPEVIYDVYCVFGYLSLNKGDFITTMQYATDCVKVMRRVGLIHQELSIRLMLLCGLLMAGRWAEAVREAHELQDLAIEHDASYILLCVLDFLALVSALQGQENERTTYLVASKQLADRVLATHPAMHAGQTVSPAEVIMMIVGGVPLRLVTVSWAITHGLPVYLTMLQGIQHLRASNAVAVASLVEALHRAAQEYTSPNYFEGVAHFLQGLLLRQQGELHHAVVFARHGYAVFVALGTPFEAALAQLLSGKLSEQIDPDGSSNEMALSQAKFERLGAWPFARWAQTFFSSVDDSLQGLSRRESEIARCVVLGFSNKKIAEELGISPRTVSTHLDKIFKKLEVNSRAQLILKVNS